MGPCSFYHSELRDSSRPILGHILYPIPQITREHHLRELQTKHSLQTECTDFDAKWHTQYTGKGHKTLSSLGVSRSKVRVKGYCHKNSFLQDISRTILRILTKHGRHIRPTEVPTVTVSQKLGCKRSQVTVTRGRTPKIYFKAIGNSPSGIPGLVWQIFLCKILTKYSKIRLICFSNLYHKSHKMLFSSAYTTRTARQLKMSTTHTEGRWRGRRPEARRREALECRGSGVWGGAPQPLPSMGVWGHCPQKILKFNSANMFIFSTISRQRQLFHSLFLIHLLPICSSSICCIQKSKHSKTEQ